MNHTPDLLNRATAALAGRFDTWQHPAGLAMVRADALDALPYLPPGLFDAVVTDPPYSSGGLFRSDRTQTTLQKYVQTETAAAITHIPDFPGDSRDQHAYLVWVTLWATAAFHASSPGAVFCCFSDWRQVPVLSDAIQAAGWTWRNLATWWKPGCRMQKARFSASSEHVLYATRGPHAADAEGSPQNVFPCQGMNNTDKRHIAQKPIDVMRWVLLATRPHGLTLDPFAGSASTGMACYHTRRAFLGFEVDGAIYADAVARLTEETTRTPLADLADQADQPTQRDLFETEAA